MVPIAPRYDRAIVRLAYALDDRNWPMAETWRRVGVAAEALGLFRPSYPHLRRFLVAKRRRERAVLHRRQSAILVAGLAVGAAALAASRHIPAKKFVAQRHKRKDRLRWRR
jgi:hypothetical protein